MRWLHYCYFVLLFESAITSELYIHMNNAIPLMDDQLYMCSQVFEVQETEVYVTEIIPWLNIVNISLRNRD